MALDKNKHLKCVLKSHNIENNEELMTAYRGKRDEVRENVKVKFGTKIYRIIHSGSYKKCTAVNIKFDMDLVIPFKRNGDTLEQIFNAVYDYFNTEYRKLDTTLLSVRKQKVAIGLEFMVDGHMLYLDIVPGREITDYEKDGDLNLFINEQMGVFGKSTTLKTNIQKQIDHVANSTDARDMIRLMKIWKRRNNGEIKSFVLELIVIRALDGYKGASDLWSKLEHVIGYIRDNIETVKLVDPGNSNNVVSDSLESFQKTSISDSMKWLLESVASNENSLKTYFPVNSEYPCEEPKPVNSGYSVGAAGAADRLNRNDFG